MHHHVTVTILAFYASSILAAPLQIQNAPEVLAGQQKRAAGPRMKWGAFGSDGDGLGGLGEWIATGKTPFEVTPADLTPNNKQKRAAEPRMEWGAFGSDGDGLGGLGEWIATGKTPFEGTSADLTPGQK